MLLYYVFPTTTTINIVTITEKKMMRFQLCFSPGVCISYKILDA